MREVPYSPRDMLNTDTFVVETCDVALKIVASNHSSRLWFSTHMENFIFLYLSESCCLESRLCVRISGNKYFVKKAGDKKAYSI